MKLPLNNSSLLTRSDVHFVVGALLAVGVVVAFVACVHAF